MDPHGSQIENASLKEEKVRDKTHNVVLGMSCRNSWRPKIQQSSLSLKVQPVLKVLLLWNHR